MLAINVCVMAFGGMIVAAVTTSARRTAMLIGAAICVIALILASAGREEQPGLVEFGIWLAVCIAVGTGVTLGLHLLLVEFKPGIFARLGPWLRRSLATKHWVEKTDAPASNRRDIVRRWIIAISASAGSVVGSLVTLELFWTSAATAITPIGLLTLMLLAVISILLFGPMHERVIAQGLAGENGEHETEDGPLLKNLSWRTAGRFALVLAVLLIMDLAYSSLEQSLKEGKLEAVYSIFYNFATPAIVSYYWTAALQARVARVWRQTTWPTTLLSTVLSLAVGLSGLYLAGTALTNASYEPGQVLLVVGILMVMSLLLAVVLGFIATGLSALLGGLAIDYGRTRHFIPKLLAALMIATLPGPIILYAITSFAEAEVSAWEYLSYFPPIVGWLVALRLSGFLKLATPPAQPVPEMPTAVGA